MCSVAQALIKFKGLEVIYLDTKTSQASINLFDFLQHRDSHYEDTILLASATYRKRNLMLHLSKIHRSRVGLQ